MVARRVISASSPSPEDTAAPTEPGITIDGIVVDVSDLRPVRMPTAAAPPSTVLVIKFVNDPSGRGQLHLQVEPTGRKPCHRDPGLSDYADPLPSDIHDSISVTTTPSVTPSRSRRRAVAAGAVLTVAALGLFLGLCSAPSPGPTPAAATIPETSPSTSARGSSIAPASIRGGCRELVLTAAAALGAAPQTWTQDLLDEGASTGAALDDVIRQRLTSALDREAESNHGDLDLAPNIRALDAAVLQAQPRPCSSP